MGFLVDYSCECFIFDEGFLKVVRKVFVDLYNKGWIYCGEFIINWDLVVCIVFLDIEVIYKDVEGVFYYMNYMLEDGLCVLEVVIICFEIMFGDVVVVVNLEDLCYKDLIG